MPRISILIARRRADVFGMYTITSDVIEQTKNGGFEVYLSRNRCLQLLLSYFISVKRLTIQKVQISQKYWPFSIVKPVFRLLPQICCARSREITRGLTKGTLVKVELPPLPGDARLKC